MPRRGTPARRRPPKSRDECASSTSRVVLARRPRPAENYHRRRWGTGACMSQKEAVGWVEFFAKPIVTGVASPAMGTASLYPSYQDGPLSPVLDEGAVVELGHRLLQLRLGVHHDRPIPGDRLLDGLARDEDKPDAVVAGLDRDLVA